MAVPPPGDASGGSKTASAGDNTVDIRVPDSEAWELYSLSAINTTKAVRINIYIGFGGEKSKVHTDIQASTDDSVIYNPNQPLKLPAGQVITIEWKNCDNSDALEYDYLIERERRTQ